jgi:hypothetical protein
MDACAASHLYVSRMHASYAISQHYPPVSASGLARAPSRRSLARRFFVAGHPAFIERPADAGGSRPGPPTGVRCRTHASRRCPALSCLPKPRAFLVRASSGHPCPLSHAIRVLRSLVVPTPSLAGHPPMGRPLAVSLHSCRTRRSARLRQPARARTAHAHDSLPLARVTVLAADPSEALHRSAALALSPIDVVAAREIVPLEPVLSGVDRDIELSTSNASPTLRRAFSRLTPLLIDPEEVFAPADLVPRSAGAERTHMRRARRLAKSPLGSSVRGALPMTSSACRATR